MKENVDSKHSEEGSSLISGHWYNTAWNLRTNICVSQDHVLIELTQAGLKGSTEGSESYEEDPYLVVNPNYLLEDWDSESNWTELRNCGTPPCGLEPGWNSARDRNVSGSDASRFVFRNKNWVDGPVCHIHHRFYTNTGFSTLVCFLSQWSWNQIMCGLYNQ